MIQEIPALAPDWLIAQCGRASERTQSKLAAPDGIDQNLACERAKEYLLKQAALAIQGNGGDDTTYQVACRVKDFGVPEKTATDLMAEHWNLRCEPPWNQHELRQKVRNAYMYSQKPVGIDAPEVRFRTITPDEEDKCKPENPDRKRRLHIEMFGEIKPDLSKKALVQDFLDHGGMSVIYGDSNTGKSFFALHLALQIARGEKFYEREVDQGGAVYVAAEGGGSFRKRIAAFARHYCLESTNIPFGMIPCSVDLLTPNADTAELIELIHDFQKNCCTLVKYVVIDTLARAIAGGNENSSEDMGAFVRNVDRIRAETGAHVIVVHHSGKDKAKGARGHSSLRAATDTEIEVANGIAKVTKQRDHESGDEFGFSLESVQLGVDPYGKVVTSCVLRTQDVAAMRAFARKPIAGSSNAGKALSVLQELISIQGKPARPDLKLLSGRSVVLENDWKTAFLDRFYADSTRQTRFSTFSRVFQKLSESRHIIEMGGYVALSE